MASAILDTSSFSNNFLLWNLTVSGETNINSAISPIVNPLAENWRTSFSRLVSFTFSTVFQKSPLRSYLNTLLLPLLYILTLPAFCSGDKLTIQRAFQIFPFLVKKIGVNFWLIRIVFPLGFFKLKS